MTELIRRAQQGDKSAAETLITENTGLIWSVVKRYFGRGVESDDLYQLGSIGFLKAVYGYDTEYGTQFSTYAVPKIAGEIRRFLRDDGTVKVSRTLKERSALIKATRQRLTAQFRREPSVTELSEATGLTCEEIASAETATAPAESIHRELGEDGFTLEDVLCSDESEQKLIERVSLQSALKKLPEKERQVIALRFFHGLTQEKAAAIVKVSQVQVSRLEKKALQRLKTLL